MSEGGVFYVVGWGIDFEMGLYWYNGFVGIFFLYLVIYLKKQFVIILLMNIGFECGGLVV